MVKKKLKKGLALVLAFTMAMPLHTTAKNENEDTDWKSILFHNLKGGSYAVYRRKHKGIGEFHKEIHIGKKVLLVEHTKEGGGASWMFASYRENQ